MYKKQLVLGALCLLFAVAFVIFTVFPIREQDQEKYHRLIESSTPSQTSLSSKHVREKVCKEIWFEENHCRIESEDSHLFFQQEGKGINVKEQLETVRCFLQKGGELHYVEAKQATYHYNTRRLVAHDVRLWKYCQEELLMTGIAREVELLNDGKKVRLQAEQFQARFTPKQTGLFESQDEMIVQADRASYNDPFIHLTGHVYVENAMGKLEAESATLTHDESHATKLDFPWIELSGSVVLTLANGSNMNCAHAFLDYTTMSSFLKGEPQVKFTNEKGEVFADQASIDYREREGSIEPTLVILNSHVQLINQQKDQYALADSLTFYPDEQLMTLEGKQNRVLFFDKKQDMQLSAPKIHAKKHADKESIRGIGDVRFVFRQEELNQLKERFRW